MTFKKHSRSVRKYIREEKARIRRSESDPAERDRILALLRARFSEQRHEERTA